MQIFRSAARLPDLPQPRREASPAAIRSGLARPAQRARRRGGHVHAAGQPRLAPRKVPARPRAARQQRVRGSTTHALRNELGRLQAVLGDPRLPATDQATVAAALRRVYEQLAQRQALLSRMVALLMG